MQVSFDKIREAEKPQRIVVTVDDETLNIKISMGVNPALITPADFFTFLDRLQERKVEFYRYIAQQQVKHMWKQYGVEPPGLQF